MKRITLIAMLVLATGCAKNAERTDTKGVGGFQVETLFTHDGCTVYRFEDGGRNRCFVKCENGSDSTITTHSAGKSSFPETIQTETYVPTPSVRGVTNDGPAASRNPMH